MYLIELIMFLATQNKFLLLENQYVYCILLLCIS